MNLKQWKHALFSAFAGDWDAKQALQDGAALDPDCAHTFMDSAAEKQLTSEYRNWTRRQTRPLNRAAMEPKAEKLFDLGPDVDLRSVRATVIIDGEEYPLESLSGEQGAAVLRAVASRDEKQAKTMLSRVSLARKLADALEAAAEKAGRPVTVAEVIGDKAA